MQAGRAGDALLEEGTADSAWPLGQSKDVAEVGKESRAPPLHTPHHQCGTAVRRGDRRP